MRAYFALKRENRRGGYTVRGKRFESTSGPATLGTTAKADLLLRTWCNGCRRHVDVDSDEQAARYGVDLPVRDWAARLVCSQCGSHAVDFVVAPRKTGGL
jgi:hypothetical protein